MKKDNNPFENMPHFVLRTPLLPFGFYSKLTQGEVVSSDSLKTICEDPVIKEAIFLASPTVYYATEKMISGILVDKPGKVTHLRRMKLTRVNELPRFDLSLG